jgi:hypothetical protein
VVRRTPDGKKSPFGSWSWFWVRILGRISGLQIAWGTGSHQIAGIVSCHGSTKRMMHVRGPRNTHVQFQLAGVPIPRQHQGPGATPGCRTSTSPACTHWPPQMLPQAHSAESKIKLLAALSDQEQRRLEPAHSSAFLAAFIIASSASRMMSSAATV